MRQIALFFGALLTGVGPLWADDAAHELYLKQVKPILTERCFACHGALKQESGLRLDTASRIRQGGDSGSAITAGKSAESLLIQRVTAAESERMPAEGEPLSAAQIALLKKWIDEGAKAPDEALPPDPRDHWSYRPVVRPSLPSDTGAIGAIHPIDALLLAKQKQRGLQPLPEAPRSILLRRVYLDLIGLPPTRLELQAFVADTAPDAYEKVVGRLLGSPHYGERWARHWMDVWRYADAFGLDADVRYSWRHMWRWRDWIAQSLNADKGYDRMIVEMLAADEVAPNDSTIVAANGFLARSWYLFNRNVWLDNIVEHTSRGLLGITMNCARCHDHKYDPIAQRDYYQLRAFFEPHKLRSERIPGEADVNKDGVARAYDADLESQTYVFLRGDENQPDKEHAVKPAVPQVFGKGVEIREVKLPLEAYYPALRVFEQQETLVAADRKCHETLAALQRANDALASVERRVAAAAEPVGVPPPTSQAIVLADDFKKPRPELWQSVGGDWRHEGGSLLQKQATATQSRMSSLKDHPRDFSASMQFSLVEGGAQCVGLAFDADQRGYIGVFMSPAGPKVQIYYVADGRETYPADAIREIAVNQGQTYDLKVAVRDQLVNVWVDDKLLLAHKLLQPRRAGHFALTTFQAVVKFAGVAVAALPAQAALTETVPAHSPGVSPELKAALDGAKLAAESAAKNEGAARTQLISIQSRQSAERAKYSATPPANFKDLALAAARAERTAAAADADAKLSAAKIKLSDVRAALKSSEAMKAKAASEALPGAEKELAEAQKQWTALVTKPADDTPNYSPLGPVYPSTSSGRRLALARWIAHRDNPLTARVAVNHIWMWHMGEPLVESTFDFGLRTPRPLHAELLDWLASEFMDNGWSMKKLHRLIVTSQAYRRMSTAVAGDHNEALDADNRYLWRMNVRRLEGEIVRDSLLHMAEKLDATLGGPDLPVASASAGTRRTLYYRYAREPHDKVNVMAVFDGPSVEECYRRQETIAPQQALLMMNSALTLRAARDIAAAIGREVGDNDVPDTSRAFVTAAFERILSRAPSASECTQCETALVRLAELAAVNAPKGGSSPHVRARAGLVHVLLNHNDFVSIR